MTFFIQTGYGKSKSSISCDYLGPSPKSPSMDFRIDNGFHINLKKGLIVVKGGTVLNPWISEANTFYYSIRKIDQGIITASLEDMSPRLPNNHRAWGTWQDRRYKVGLQFYYKSLLKSGPVVRFGRFFQGYQNEIETKNYQIQLSLCNRG